MTKTHQLESRGWALGNEDTLGTCSFRGEGVGCEDLLCSFEEQIGWWRVMKSLAIGFEGKGCCEDPLCLFGEQIG
jgi:hypothetical protein